MLGGLGVGIAACLALLFTFRADYLIGTAPRAGDVVCPCRAQVAVLVGTVLCAASLAERLVLVEPST